MKCPKMVSTTFRVYWSGFGNVTLGVYRISRATPNTPKHLSIGRSYTISIHKDNSGLLRARICSRHVSSKYILVDILVNLQLLTLPGQNLLVVVRMLRLRSGVLGVKKTSRYDWVPLIYSRCCEYRLGFRWNKNCV